MRSTVRSFVFLFSTSAIAQCPFDPTITPANLIFCPGAGDTLSTQVYDAYQWYRDGTALPGATDQFLYVDYQDGGSQFTVAATLNGCTEVSPSVLVDGWAFLLPYVIHQGDAPYTIDGNGEGYYCEGDTVVLIAGSVTEHIQWTDNNIPIPGATDDTLIVTGDGLWSMSGAPSECPDFIMGLGVTISTTFTPTQQPGIVVNGDQLCATPSGNPFQWYLDGAPILAGACFVPEASGTYTLAMDFPGECEVPSTPVDISVGIGERGAGVVAALRVDAAGERLLVIASAPLRSAWELIDAQGRRLAAGRLAGCAQCPIDLRGLGSGTYWLRSVAFDRTLPFVVVR